jgi:hypothetical protein
VAHLAARDELADGAGDVLDRHVRVDAVLVEHVDRVDAEPLQGPVDGAADRVGSTGQTGLLALLVEREPELGGDHHLIADGSQGLANQFLVDERAVDLRGVEERDTALDRRPQQSDHLVAVTGVGAVALAHAHAAEPEGRDLKAVAEPALLHRVSSIFGSWVRAG